MTEKELAKLERELDKLAEAVNKEEAEKEIFLEEYEEAKAKDIAENGRPRPVIHPKVVTEENGKVKVLADKSIQKSHYNKFTSRTVFKIKTALENGSTRKAAANMAGVSEEYIHRWSEWHPGFKELIERAEAVAEIRATMCVTKPLDQTNPAFNPKLALDAGKFWLERRRRTEYGQSLDLKSIPSDVLINLLGGSEIAPVSRQELEKQRLLAIADSQEAQEAITTDNSQREPISVGD